jgi:YVTN family beta-propeller protein
VLVGGEATIKVINTQTYAVEAEIPEIINAGTGRMSLDGSRLYVSNQYQYSIFVIDTSSNTVIDTIPGVGPEPGQLAISPDGNTLYVASYGGAKVVDIASHTIVATVPEITNGSLAITPDGSRVYANIAGSGVVKVLDTLTNTVVDTIAVGSDSLHIIASPDGSRVYVTDYGEGNVYVIDTANDSVIAAIPVGGHPGAMAIGTAPQRTLTTVAPAQIWVGLKNSDDVGVKFDLLAELYKDGALITSGQLNSVAAGGSGFTNAQLDTIPFDSFAPMAFPIGLQLQLKLYARNACSGSGHNSGVARLWFNDTAANSQFGATINASNTYYLRDGFTLVTSAGSGPKKTIDIQSGAKCSPFKTFGTWTITP